MNAIHTQHRKTPPLLARPAEGHSTTPGLNTRDEVDRKNAIGYRDSLKGEFFDFNFNFSFFSFNKKRLKSLHPNKINKFLNGVYLCKKAKYKVPGWSLSPSGT